MMSAEQQEVMSGGGRKPLGCTLKKAECTKKSDCVWVQGKGCRHEDNVRLLSLAKMAKMAKKAKSPSPVRAKSPSPVKARSPSPVRAAKPAAKKGRKPMGCNLKKPECDKKSDCVWVPGKGCRPEDNVPLGLLAKLMKKVAPAPAPPKAKTPSPVKAKTPSPVKAAKPAAKKGRKPTGCNLKKPECAKKSDCVWVPSKGCRHEDSLPLGLLAKLNKKA